VSTSRPSVSDLQGWRRYAAQTFGVVVGLGIFALVDHLTGVFGIIH